MRAQTQTHARTHAKSEGEIKRTQDAWNFINYTVRYGTVPVRKRNTVRFLAWRTRVSWESERRTEDGWYPGRKRRFSFLGSTAKRDISRVSMPTNNTTCRRMCSSRFAQI